MFNMIRYFSLCKSIQTLNELYAECIYFISNAVSIKVCISSKSGSVFVNSLDCKPYYTFSKTFYIMTILLNQLQTCVMPRM